MVTLSVCHLWFSVYHVILDINLYSFCFISLVAKIKSLQLKNTSGVIIIVNVLSYSFFF